MDHIRLSLLVFIIFHVRGETYLEDVLTSHDRSRLRGLFESTRITDFETACYVAGGLAILGGNDKAEQQICQYLKDHQDTSDVQDIYYATSAAASLKNCNVKVSYPKLYEKVLKNYITDNANVSTLSSIVLALSNMGIKVDQNVISAEKLIQMAFEEEQPLIYGETFRALSRIIDADKNMLSDIVEDVVAQADETSSTAYFEGDMVTTSVIVTGIVELVTSTNTSLSGVQASKFGNYFLTSKYTMSLKEAYYLLIACNSLATNKVVVPIAVTLANHKTINFQNSDLKVNVQNILGEAVSPCLVTLTSLQPISGKKELLSKPFNADKNRIVYSVPVYTDSLSPGPYIVTLSAKSQESSYIFGSNNVQLVVTVSYSIAVESAELSILEKDQNIAVNSISLQYPQRYLEEIVADYHSKVQMSFSLYNKQNKQKVNAHQTFVRLVSMEGEEIFFVASPSEGVYVFDLDVRASAEEFFGQKSGVYEMSLIVGDASLENPFSWDIGTITLKFQGTPTSISEEARYHYKPHPEITHIFQEPEKRPPTVVSASFTGLVLVPLASLLVVWLVLGANVSNIMLSSPWSIIFHVGLIGIFALYYCFWTRLNMFETLKYLILLGLITFIAGNKMLHIVAKAKVTQ